MTRDEAIDQAMSEHLLDESYRGYVTAHFDRNDGFGFCCNTACDPCVLTLERVVKRARALLEAGPEPTLGA